MARSVCGPALIQNGQLDSAASVASWMWCWTATTNFQSMRWVCMDLDPNNPVLFALAAACAAGLFEFCTPPRSIHAVRMMIAVNFIFISFSWRH